MSRREVEEWFSQLGGELHRIDQELSAARPRLASGRAWEPRIDLIEESHLFLIKAEIAGVRAEDIQLVYIPERHSILLRGVRGEEDHSDGCRTSIHTLEILYGPFQREVRLPESPIDASQIRAQYANGLLVVHVPKAEAMVVTHTITITEI